MCEVSIPVLIKNKTNHKTENKEDDTRSFILVRFQMESTSTPGVALPL